MAEIHDFWCDGCGRKNSECSFQEQREWIKATGFPTYLADSNVKMNHFCHRCAPAVVITSHGWSIKWDKDHNPIPFQLE